MKINVIILLFAGLIFGSSNIHAQLDDPITFSFASDRHANGPTFRLNGDQITSAGTVRVNHLVDLNHDFPGGLRNIRSIFKFDAKISKHTVEKCGDNWLHSWKVRGRYQFVSVSTGRTVYTARFRRAVLTSLSTSRIDAGRTLTLQDNDKVDRYLRFVPGPALLGLPNVPPQLRVFPNHLNVGENFAFTLTSVKPVLAEIPLDRNGFFVGNTTTEGSYSAGAVRRLPGFPAQD